MLTAFTVLLQNGRYLSQKFIYACPLPAVTSKPVTIFIHEVYEFVLQRIAIVIVHTQNT
jgi:hypothetical protein